MLVGHLFLLMSYVNVRSVHEFNLEISGVCFELRQTNTELKVYTGDPTIPADSVRDLQAW